MLTDKQIQEFKDIFEKEHGKQMTWEEAAEGARNLLNLAELMYEMAQDQFQLDQKLKDNPKGFHPSGIGFTCFICGDSVSNEQTWYDKYGIKCLICQKAIDKKIIPGSAAKNKDSWYSKYDLEDRFNIDRHAVNRFIKQGILKPRIVPSENGKPHAYLFLVKDNKDTLPPKKLTESYLVKETKDGKDWYHPEPWYKFVDPNTVLKSYKIIDFLKVFKRDQ